MDVAAHVVRDADPCCHLATWHEKESTILVEASGYLGHRANSHVCLVAFRAPPRVGKRRQIRLENRRLDRRGRPSACHLRYFHPVIRIRAEAVVVGDGEEVIAAVLVGGYGLLRQHVSVRPASMGMEHALVPAQRT